MSHSPTVRSTRVRLRTRQACQPCRRRRRKCNGELPCSQCSFYQYDCVFGRAGTTSSTQQTLDNHNDDDRQSPARFGPQHPAAQLNELQSNADSRTHNGPGQMRLLQPGEAVGGHAHGLHDPPTRFFNERKGRYCGRYSSVAFPHLVRSCVGSTAPLRLHAYGWNVNVRPEPQPPGWSSIRRVITYQEIEKYSSIYLEAVSPVYELLDASSYHERSRLYWASHSYPSPDFEALVAGVVALGSLFSREGSLAELQLVEHAKTILDIGCSYAPGRLSVDQGAAWVLRTIYLRCTTRPHMAWFASCASMHVAEALGLHLVQPKNTDEASNARVRILHCALLLNGLISAEYGRSRVRIDMPGGTIPDTVPPSEKLALAQALFALEDRPTGSDRLQALESIAQLHLGHSVLQLHKVDIAMHWYRRNVLGAWCTNLTHSEHKILTGLLEDGLSRVYGLLASGYPWWNVISTPFQSLLVLMNIDSDDSLPLVPDASKCLERTADTFGASLAAEAVEIAQHLVKALKDKKLAHANHLCDVAKLVKPTNAMDMTGSTEILLNDAMDDWLEMFDLNGDNSLGWATSTELS